MLHLVLILGLVIAAIGLVGLLWPKALIRIVQAAWKFRVSLYLVVLLRLAFGLILLVAAHDTRFPLALQILGGLSILSAVAALAVGFDRVQRFLNWWSRRPEWFIRVWCVLAVAFGGFLVLAAV